jgi:hypothetical protein
MPDCQHAHVLITTFELHLIKNSRNAVCKNFQDKQTPAAGFKPRWTVVRRYVLKQASP